MGDPRRRGGISPPVSFAIDVNVLIDAANEDGERFELAKLFLAERLKSKEIFCLPWLVAMSFVRIATDARIFRRPLTVSETLHALRGLLAQPQVQPLAERPGFFATYEEIAAAPAIRGQLVPDAHLAAILRQHGVRTLYTRDRDFRRFEFLDVREPEIPTGVTGGGRGHTAGA